jgi:non-canonical (house-cleaning) NTP pyrophosphatase
MLVILGSTRGPKLKALEAVLRELGGEFGSAEIQAHETESGVRETPLDRAEIMRGAWNRAEAVRALLPDADFWAGMEGGLHIADCGLRISSASGQKKEIRNPKSAMWMVGELGVCQ